MKRNYEVVYVVKAEIEDTKKDLIKDFIKKIIDEDESAEFLARNDLGYKKMAYKIQKKDDGYYVVDTFKSEPDFPKELDRRIKIEETIIRHIIVEIDDEAVAEAKKKEELQKRAEEEKVEDKDSYDDALKDKPSNNLQMDALNHESEKKLSDEGKSLRETSIETDLIHEEIEANKATETKAEILEDDKHSFAKKETPSSERKTEIGAYHTEEKKTLSESGKDLREEAVDKAEEVADEYLGDKKDE